ncbi:hypothetical protein [Streptomyces sp. NPDC003697]
MRFRDRAAIIAAGSLIALSAMQTSSSAVTPVNNAPSVSLGGCSSFPPTPCGEVQNDTSDTWVRVSLNWTCGTSYEPIGSSCPKSIKTVSPHSHIGGGSVDVDAYEVPKNCTFWGDSNGFGFVHGAGWYKFSSVETITISHTECRGV